MPRIIKGRRPEIEPLVMVDDETPEQEEGKKLGCKNSQERYNFICKLYIVHCKFRLFSPVAQLQKGDCLSIIREIQNPQKDTGLGF